MQLPPRSSDGYGFCLRRSSLPHPPFNELVMLEVLKNASYGEGVPRAEPVTALVSRVRASKESSHGFLKPNGGEHNSNICGAPVRTYDF